MNKTIVLSLAKSLFITLVFFALGRLLAIRWGNAGFLLAVLLLVLFYGGWWIMYRRDKK